jgi:integrase
MPRLPRNMVLKSGRYYFRKMIDGKEITRPLGANYRRAYAKLKELQREDLPTRSVSTLEQLARLWLNRYVATARRDRADRRKVGQRVRKYLVPFMGMKPPQLVGQDDLWAYRAWLQQRGISDQTVKHVLSEGKCLFNWAVDAGYLSKSPVPKRLMPTIQERLPDRLTDEEVKELVRLPEPYGFVIRLGVGTGLRWGEMVRAEARHLQNGMLEVEHTKSGRVRRIPILSDLALELRNRVGRLLAMTGRSETFNRWVTGRS